MWKALVWYRLVVLFIYDHKHDANFVFTKFRKDDITSSGQCKLRKIKEIFYRYITYDCSSNAWRSLWLYNGQYVALEGNEALKFRPVNMIMYNPITRALSLWKKIQINNTQKSNRSRPIVYWKFWVWDTNILHSIWVTYYIYTNYVLFMTIFGGEISTNSLIYVRHNKYLYLDSSVKLKWNCCVYFLCTSVWSICFRAWTYNVMLRVGLFSCISWTNTWSFFVMYFMNSGD